MHIAVGADHAGYDLKVLLLPWLQSLGHEIMDFGAHRFDAQDDYPDFAAAVGKAVASRAAERGILVCGSGVGACITANKILGVRACLCHDTYTGRQGVEHDDMNVVCLGARAVGAEVAKDALRSFLSARFQPEPRFQRRLDKVIDLERQGIKGKGQAP